MTSIIKLRIVVECGALIFLLDEKSIKVTRMADNNQITLDHGETFQLQLNDKNNKVKMRKSSKINPIIKASFDKLEDKDFQSNFEVGEMTKYDLLPPPLKCPEGYTITAEDGVKYYGDRGVMTVSSTPMFISRKLVNVDNKTIEYEISKYDYSTHKIIPMYILTGKELGTNKILKLADKGVDITKLNCKTCIEYLQNFRNENDEEIPVVKKYSRTGWHDGKFIYPSNDKDYVVVRSNLDNLYSTKGTEKDWLDGIKKLFDYKFAKFGIGVGLATPLIDILKLPNTLVQFRGRSMSGKTTLLSIISSIYGNPEYYMKNFNATQNALESLAVEFNYMPFVIDEFQITSRKEIKSLVYTIFEGTSRARSSASGRVNDTQNFKTMTIMSGEVSFTNDNAPMGAKRRCIEIGDDNIIPSEIAVEMQNLIKYHYGVIGRKWTSYIESQKEIFRAEYDRLKSNEDLKMVYANKLPEHFNIIVAAFTAFKIFRREFYNIEESKADSETLKSVLELAEDFPNTNDLKNTTRALEVVRDYFDKYRNYFVKEHCEHDFNLNQVKGYYKVLNNENHIGFKRADILCLLKSRNFDSGILKEFKEEGAIIVDNGQRNRFTKTIRFNGALMPVVLFRVNKLEQVANG